MRRELCAVALAGLLVLAGCSSAVAPDGSGTGTPGATTGGDGTAASTASGTGSGTVNFYVSDEINAIDDFEHLNVTIDKVSFRRSGDEESTETASAAEPTQTPEAEGEDTTQTPGPTQTPEGGTGTPTPGPTESAESGSAEGDDDSDEGWIVREVDATTVDLTELRGENAKRLSQLDLPEGTYTQVRIHITGVEGTLTNGEAVTVKLPSQKLRLKKQFTVGDGEEVDFVYDATVFEAGKSGKYILKPVASESGTDVPIKEVVEDGGEGEGEGALGARFLGEVNPGEATTMKVTHAGKPAKDATVTVGEKTYRTGEDGTVMFDVPDGTEELEVTVAYEDQDVELKRSFGGEPDGEGEVGQNDGKRGGSKQSGKQDGTEEDGEQDDGSNDGDATADVVAVSTS